MISLRKCIGCGEKKEKKDLIRVVRTSKTKEKVELSVCSGHMEGRGAYLCKNNDCFNKAKKSKRLERAFSCKVDSEIYNELERMVKNSGQ